MIKQRWTDKEVVERIVEGIKRHWQCIGWELNNEDRFKGTWDDFCSNWVFWNQDINKYYYHIVQLQHILDIKDDEVNEIIQEP